MNTLAFHLIHHKHPAQYWKWTIMTGAVVITVMLTLGVSYLAVQVYPAGRLSPGSHLSGVPVGGMNQTQAVTRLEEAGLSDRQVELYINRVSVTTTYGEAGVVFDLEESVRKNIRQQEISRRYAESAWKFWSSGNGRLVAGLDDDRFADFLTDDLSAYQEPPADAWIDLEEDRAVIRPEQIAWRIDENDLRSSLLAAASRLDSSVAVAVHKQHPGIYAEQLDESLRKAQAVLDMDLELTYKEKSFPIPRDEKNSWLTVTAGDEGLPKVTAEVEKVRSYLEEIANDIDKDPQPHMRRLHDGSIRGTTEGVVGYSLDLDANAEKIRQAILTPKPQTEVALKVETIKPIINYHRTYSRSSKGIDALLSDFASERWGQYGLRFRSLSGDITASHNANEPFVTASTYKLFLAYAVYHEIENGRLRYTDSTASGSVAFCLREMIVYSTNPCATALGNKIGWKRIDKILGAAGLNNTKLDNYTAVRINKTTTANDAANLLQMLEKGELINTRHRNQLLGYLKTQIYRDGTPAGFSGLTVANKIGFLEGYLHDIAIVYGRNDTYVLAGYSYGGSFAEFAELSRRLKSILE